MIGLVSELLDAGRIDTGTLSVSPEPSEVAALVDRARTTFLSGGGRHTVLIDLPPDLPRVMADRQRVEQVLSNLLANAARQAPESSPIPVEAERDGVHVAVSVSDEGRGIPPERLAQPQRRRIIAAVLSRYFDTRVEVPRPRLRRRPRGLPRCCHRPSPPPSPRPATDGHSARYAYPQRGLRGLHGRQSHPREGDAGGFIRSWITVSDRSRLEECQSLRACRLDE